MHTFSKIINQILMAMLLLATHTTVCLSESQGYPKVSKEQVKYASIWDECDSLLRFTFDNGTVLLIGGSSGMFQKTIDTTYLFDSGGAVCVGLLIGDQKAKELVREGGWGGNPFQIKVTPDRKVIVTEKLQNVSLKTSYPFIEQTLTCDTGNCVVSEKKCVLDLPKDIHQKLVQRTNQIPQILQKIVNKSQKSGHSNSSVDPLYLIVELSNALTLRAMLGDPEAEKLLHNPPVQLDGAWGELWEARAFDLDTAKKLGCVK